jgi:hypothetical protein
MINDLSESLRALLTQPGLPSELAAAQIVFDRPSESFNPPQTTIDLFAYELREDHNVRPVLPGSGGRRTLRIACSYLITAWPIGGSELALKEQQLLGEVLQVFSAYPVIPATFLRGALVGQDPPQIVVLHPDALGNMSEFWTSLGNKLRPSLSVTATIAVPAFQAPPS